MVVKKRVFFSMCLWLGENRINPKLQKGMFLFSDSAQGKPESVRPVFPWWCTLESKPWSRRGYCKNRMRYPAKVAMLGMIRTDSILLGMSLSFVIKLEWLPNKDAFSEETLGLSYFPNVGRKDIVCKNESSEKGALSVINIYVILCV